MIKKPLPGEPVPTAPKKNSPFKTVIQNLEFHNFDETPNFTGLYKDTQTIGEEDEKFTANVFADVETGEECYISNSYSVAKAIQKAKLEYADGIRDIVFLIEFLGKTMLKGKPFNQFKIGYCTLEEYEESQK